MNKKKKKESLGRFQRASARLRLFAMDRSSSFFKHHQAMVSSVIRYVPGRAVRARHDAMAAKAAAAERGSGVHGSTATHAHYWRHYIRSAATSFVRKPFDHQSVPNKMFFFKKDLEELRCHYRHCTDAEVAVRQLLGGLVGLQQKFR